MNEYEDCLILVSVSGGKDSTAMCLNLLEKGYAISDFKRVFCDTGWEHEHTYEHLNELEKTIGKIDHAKIHIPIKEEYREYIEDIENDLGFESPFVRRSFKYLFFPTRRGKWCTQELKIHAQRDYMKKYDEDIINLIGIRKEESPRRAKMKEWEFNKTLDCYSHRPILEWTYQDVINIHHRFNLVPNRLYLNGSNRVGCYPCIYSRKSEIKQLDQKRIDIIRKMEKIFRELRYQKTGEYNQSSFFTPQIRGIKTDIDSVVEWSKTTRGGKQFELFSTEEPTCKKWGLCGI